MTKPRHDGWTPPRRAAFLAALAAGESVGRAAASAGLSRASVYALAARDAGFAADWAAAYGAAHPVATIAPWSIEDVTALSDKDLIRQIKAITRDGARRVVRLRAL